MATVNITDIKTLIGNQLGSNGISDDQRIVEDLGAESADVANIIAAVEDKYGISVPEDDIKNLSTVRDVYMEVQKRV